MTNHTLALNDAHAEAGRLFQLADVITDILMDADHGNAAHLIECVNKASALATIARDRVKAMEEAITAALDAEKQEAA